MCQSLKNPCKALKVNRFLRCFNMFSSKHLDIQCFWFILNKFISEYLNNPWIKVGKSLLLLFNIQEPLWMQIIKRLDKLKTDSFQMVGCFFFFTFLLSKNGVWVIQQTHSLFWGDAEQLFHGCWDNYLYTGGRRAKGNSANTGNSRKLLLRENEFSALLVLIRHWLPKVEVVGKFLEITNNFCVFRENGKNITCMGIYLNYSKWL